MIPEHLTAATANPTSSTAMELPIDGTAAAAPIECVFFDCDDCLYKDNWATMGRVTAKIGEYCRQELGLPDGRPDELYRAHGTTLCGLVREGHLREERVAGFLREVHDIPLGFGPDPRLRAMLEAVPHPRWVFTASIREHAVRCLQRLGIEDLFLGIVSASSPDMIERAGYVSKHDPRCFAAAMAIAGVPPERARGCVLLDDSAKNLQTAKQLGWRTVLVGRHTSSGVAVQCPEADTVVDTLHELPGAVPEIFAPRAAAERAPPKVTPESAKERIRRVAAPHKERAKRARCGFGSSPERASPARRVLRRACSTASTPDDVWTPPKTVAAPRLQVAEPAEIDAGRAKLPLTDV